MVAPVPYRNRPAWNGSISSEPIIQPSLGVPCQARYGAAEVSIVLCAVTDTQVDPPLVDRKMSSTGPHRPIVATMTVCGCCASTVSPAYPKPDSPFVYGTSGVMFVHVPAAERFHTAPLFMLYGPGESPYVTYSVPSPDSRPWCGIPAEG